MPGARTAPIAAPTHKWAALHGRANGLDGLAGRLRLRVDGNEVGVLQTNDGAVEIIQGAEASASVNFDTIETMLQVLGGALHPMVAILQQRARIDDGDPAFVTRILFGLLAGSPWSGLGGARPHP